VKVGKRRFQKRFSTFLRLSRLPSISSWIDEVRDEDKLWSDPDPEMDDLSRK
jgi:hypothetical protein